MQSAFSSANLGSNMTSQQNSLRAGLHVFISCMSLAVALPLHKEYASSLMAPSRVDSDGFHLSHDLRASPGGGLERVYFKLQGNSALLGGLQRDATVVYLNVSLDLSWGSSELLVEYAGGRSNGSRMRRSPLLHRCHYTGHVHRREGEGGRDVIGEKVGDSWTAISTCNGMHGIIGNNQGHFIIEPSPSSSSWDKSEHQFLHTITKSTSSNPATPPSNPHCGTRDSSSRDAVLNSKEQQQALGQRERRLILPSDNFIETAVVADASMLAHHRSKENLEAYIYTLMNMVAHLYRDASIGHSVNVILTRVVILEEAESDLSSTSGGSGQDLLVNFCKWMNRHVESPPAVSHDVAVLLTRQSICETSNGGCSVLGLAEIGSVCQRGKSCNVNKDTGLSTAFTIAHEMAHNLGVRHDGDPLLSCDSGENFIMAPSFADSTNPHFWSECSRIQLEDILSSPESSCLANRPLDLTDNFTDSHLLSGSEFTPTEQCQLHLGPNATHCSGIPSQCSSLRCRLDQNSPCVSYNVPYAPGTECNLTLASSLTSQQQRQQEEERGVCYQGECVSYAEVVTPVAGGWSSWGDWSNCSLPCGTGVQYSDRRCDSPVPRYGGQYCSGGKRKYRTCNQHPCKGAEEVDTRQRACEESPPNTSHKVWRTISLDRIAVLKLDSCRSHCIPLDAEQQEAAVIHTSSTLPDGTPCLTEHAQSQGVCLSGKCSPVGCSGELGVESSRDKCGMWCGDGTSCMSVTSAFNRVEHPGQYRYYLVLTVPAGSTNITIRETTPSRPNYLALQTAVMGDMLNGHFRVTQEGTTSLMLAGTKWNYTRQQDGTESLATFGPTDEGVALYILANEVYDGITITFNIHREGATEGLKNPVYFWNHTQWGACDVDCGRGHQERGVACWKLSSGGIVEEENEELCNPLTRPPSEQDCALGACPNYHWVEQEWEPCNVTCGTGIRTREVTCMQVSEGSPVVSELVMEDHWCALNGVPRPVEVEVCESACRYVWQHGEWGECSSHYCGEGTRERDVRCVRDREQVNDNGGATVVSEELCVEEDRPAALETCHAPEPCANYQWTTSEWTECNGACGSVGNQSRSLSCQHQNGTSVPSPFCSWQTSPVSTRQCNTRECITTTPPATPPTTPTPCQDIYHIAVCNLVIQYQVCDVGLFRTKCCASCSTNT